MVERRKLCHKVFPLSLMHNLIFRKHLCTFLINFYIFLFSLVCNQQHGYIFKKFQALETEVIAAVSKDFYCFYSVELSKYHTTTEKYCKKNRESLALSIQIKLLSKTAAAVTVSSSDVQGTLGVSDYNGNCALRLTTS